MPSAIIVLGFRYVIYCTTINNLENMKKLLQFIWELIGTPILVILGACLSILLLTWIFTGFGLMIILCPTELPTYSWIKIFIIVFDIIVFTIVIIEQVRRAYEKIYKN